MSKTLRSALTAMTLLLLTGCGFEAISGTDSALPAVTVSSEASELSKTALTTTETTAQTTAGIAPEPDDPDVSGSETPAAPAEEPYSAAHIIRNVPHYDQTSGYATACESIAAVSLLRFYGIEMDPGDFIRNHLPTAPYPSMGSDGNLHGENPADYFIGDPLRSDGYCCFSGAILKAIDSVRPGIAAVLHDRPLDKLCEDYVAYGNPVMIWATIGMQPTRKGNSWILPNGERYTHLRPVHALLLIGWDENNYYFSDSNESAEITPYPIQAVQTAYAAMRQQAIVLTVPEEMPENPAAEAETP